MTTSDYSVVFAVMVLLSVLWWFIRFEAREASRPKKERRLRTRWDDDCAENATKTPLQAASTAPDIVLKLPRRNREEPTQPGALAHLQHSAKEEK
jgi:hypothetical protein